MTEDVSFTYRLPLTYVRVIGTKTKTHDLLKDEDTVECQATVTTENGADLLGHYTVSMSAQTMATQKSTWNLLPDGRLSGADVSITAEPMAGLSAALQAGAAVLGIAGPTLAAAGPPGWLALAGATGAAAIGVGLGTRLNLIEKMDGPGKPKPKLVEPAEIDPEEWGVASQYVAKDRKAALALAELRAAEAEASQAHAFAARAAAHAIGTGGDAYPWERRIVDLERVLASIAVGSRPAEAAYVAWLALQSEVTSVEHDERLRIDELPSEAELKEWCQSTTAVAGYPPWYELLVNLRTAVSIDFEHHFEGDRKRERGWKYGMEIGGEVVHYRPPRPVVLKAWKVLPPVDSEGRGKLELVDVQRLFVAMPGNEAAISIATERDTTSGVTVAFDDGGALTKVTTEIEDPHLQRAKDIAALLSSVSGAVEAGGKIRTALTPTSLVERAAEAKAAAELGLTPAAIDPLEALKKQVAEQQLRAQLKLAHQLQAATSPPIFVAVPAAIS